MFSGPKAVKKCNMFAFPLRTLSSSLFLHELGTLKAIFETPTNSKSEYFFDENRAESFRSSPKRLPCLFRWLPRRVRSDSASILRRICAIRTPIFGPFSESLSVSTVRMNVCAVSYCQRAGRQTQDIATHFLGSAAWRSLLNKFFS